MPETISKAEIEKLEREGAEVTRIPVRPDAMTAALAEMSQQHADVVAQQNEKLDDVIELLREHGSKGDAVVLAAIQQLGSIAVALKPQDFRIIPTRRSEDGRALYYDVVRMPKVLRGG